MASENTTAIELAVVLGNTFHAHSCNAHTKYTKTGWILALKSRKGLAQARYAKNW